jgi:hypothetical protein
VRLHPFTRSALPRFLVVIGLAGTLLTTAPAHAALGTITVQATVSGKGHDSGTFSHIESYTSNIDMGLDGCALIKNKKGSILGAYSYLVRTASINFAGTKPRGPGLYLSIQNFHPSQTSSYKGYTVSGSFSINGRSYGDNLALNNETAQITDGGLSGVWADPTGNRNYPAKLLSPVHGFSFRVTWHCTALLHLTNK